MPPVCVSRPLFYGSRLYTKRIYHTPSLLRTETMMQVLHDKWGYPSDSKFVQIYRAQNRVGVLSNFWLCSIVFAARCVLYVKALELTGVACTCNYTDRTRHLRQCLPQATLSSAILTTIQLLVS